MLLLVLLLLDSLKIFDFVLLGISYFESFIGLVKFEMLFKFRLLASFFG